MIRKSLENERTAVFAGSFNPFTIGHLSILERGLKLFDRVIVAVGINEGKGETAESVQGRADELRRVLSSLSGAEVTVWRGLTVELARSVGARFLLRGVRTVADFEYERNMADINRDISGVDTVILFAEPSLSMVSSSMVRELSRFGMDVKRYMPAGLGKND